MPAHRVRSSPDRRVTVAKIKLVCVCGRGGGVRIKLSLPCVTVQPKVDFNAGVVAAGEAMIEVAHSCSPY